jgi:hypothetical protein
MTARENWGVPSTSIATPGVCGYSPRAAQTYQEPRAPRSSWPGSPPGVSPYRWLVIRWTSAWVFHGWPALS